MVLGIKGDILRIKFFSIASLYFFIFVSLIMGLVMGTAKDRQAYIKHFESPFEDNRIEIGFQYYMYGFELLNIPPQLSIIITCVLTYGILSRVWLRYVNVHWVASLLIFNFFMFSLLNYYLGTSIRMGLAMAISLYSSYKYMDGKKFYLAPLVGAFVLHYGALLYILVFLWFIFTKNLSVKFHIVMSAIGGLLLVLFFDLVLPSIGLSSYYMAYFETDFGRTERLLPFTVLFSIAAIWLTFLYSSKSKLHETSEILIVSLYSLPFIIYFLYSGNPLFGKMLMPIIFLQSIIVTNLYFRPVLVLLGGPLLISILLLLNALAIIYALKMYQYI
ncbi:EpsG family protein [Pseudidiomarina gelatinasegens]|uniref:EpsG family protein n=1 Tax=Pseudidiomarina gelatinasegens TaxID=2487740 RepID=UPI003A97423F